MLNDLFIVDAHEDIAFHISYYNRDFVNPSIPCMITLPWLKQGNVRLVFNTIYVHPKFKPRRTLDAALNQFSIYRNIYEEHEAHIAQVKEYGDILKLERDNRIGFLTLMEGADPIEEPKKLNEFYDMGVRIIGLSWNDQNKYASGNDTISGLSQEGKELIKRMNDLRITLDLSHLNEKCFWEALELCECVPIATHSNARVITNHPRNLNDDQLRAIAERGGVIGIVLYNQFLKTGSHPSCGENSRTTLEDVFAHADYMINLCGEDHVGIGSDLDGGNIDEFPDDIRKVSDLPKIAEFFLNKVYSEDRVKKIMGGNLLRALKENFD